MCLLDLGLTHWVEGPGWRQGQRMQSVPSATLFEEPCQAGGWVYKLRWLLAIALGTA